MRATLVALLGLALYVLPAAAQQRAAEQFALNARSYEELGAYSQAADELKKLVKAVPDTDAVLELALDLARSWSLDESDSLLWGPELSAALNDTLPLSRRKSYPWSRDRFWANGTYDGWPWYIARARAEVAALQGHWDQALEAARVCVEARSLAGKEWMVLALCQARTGDDEGARHSCERAVFLDPTLPEPRYLLGLMDWRANRRAEAEARFHEAVALDSTYQAAALGVVRAGLPFGRPDTLPNQFFVGVRRVGLLTASDRPKLEEHVQMDKPVVLVKRAPIKLPEQAAEPFQPIQFSLPVLVDEHGHIVLHELPWFPETAMPNEFLGPLLATLLETDFTPAEKGGAPAKSWTSIKLTIAP